MYHEPLDRGAPADTRPLGVTPSLCTFGGADFAASTRLSPGVSVAFALLVLGLLVVFAVWIAHLRARERRLARDVADLLRTLATLQEWAAQEFRALRGEFTVARVALPPLSEGEEDDPEEQRDTVAMAAPGTPAPKPADEEGETTTFFTADPPMYANRSELMRPPAPLEDHDLIGSEDIADEVARSHLGPEDNTPPRRGRTAVLVPVYRASAEGDVA
jgi:hypothetical protein